MLAPLKLQYMVVLVITQITFIVISNLTCTFLVFQIAGNYLRESNITLAPARTSDK